MVASSIDLLFESALILGAVSFSLSIFVLSKDVANKLNLSFSALTLGVAIWSLSFFLAGVLGIRAFETIHILCTLLLGPLSLLFMQLLFRPDGLFFRWCTRLAFFVCVLLVLPVTFGLDRTPWIRDVSYFSPVLIVFALLYLYLSEAFGVVKPRGDAGIFKKEFLEVLHVRNTWIYLGGTIATLLGTMDRVPWMGKTLPAVGNLFLAIYFFGLKDIVLRGDYANPRRLLGRVMADSGAALILTAIFMLTTVWVSNNWILYTLNAFLVSYLALHSIGPIRSLLHVAYQKFFFKEGARIEALIKASGAKLSGAFDAEEISRVVDEFLREAIGAGAYSIYVMDSEGQKFEKVLDASLDQKLPRALSRAYPLALHWRKVGEWKPILTSDMEAESERATMTSVSVAIQLTFDSLIKLDSTLALPLLLDRSLAGFVTLKLDAQNSQRGTGWGTLSLLKPFFLRAGEALHDLDVYASLRERERLAVLGEMSAGLAHEIRNPLGAIKGAAQVLELHENDPREPFVEIIIEEVNRLNKVVTQFLNYSKPLKGDSKFVDLRQLAREAIDRFKRKVSSEPLGQELEILLSAGGPVMAYCQADLIGQILGNFLENSYNAILSGGASKQAKPRLNVSIAVDGTSSMGDLLTITVEDNGPGIPREHIDKIFIPFFSLRKDGTGLGLPICQRIAEAHGGKIEIESSENVGTSVRLRFPSRRIPENTAREEGAIWNA
jgi:two-component system sensor histidine kinase HydH